MCKEAPMVLVTKQIVLQQLLHNCLNACLDRLVGPKCLELKGSQKGMNKDFEEFNFDPKALLRIMAEIMADPVLLPTSQTVMDRKVIERHIMSNDDDPFNRAHLAIADLVPQPDLKKEIQEFCQKHGILIDDSG